MTDLAQPGPDTRIDQYAADYLLIWANQIDARIQSTDANAELWAYHLANRRYGTCQQIIADYYGKTGSRGELSPITPGQIRKEYMHRQSSHEAKQRALGPGANRRNSRMPRHVLERFQAMGMLTDRDPTEYPT